MDICPAYHKPLMNLSRTTLNVCGAYHEPLMNLPRSTLDPLRISLGSTAWISQTSHPNCHAQSIHRPHRLAGLPLRHGWLPDHIRTVYPQPRGKSASTDAFSLRLSVPFLPPGGGPPDSLQTYGFAADTLRIPHT
jgi:hypothetical protein